MRAEHIQLSTNCFIISHPPRASPSPNFLNPVAAQNRKLPWIPQGNNAKRGKEGKGLSLKRGGGGKRTASFLVEVVIRCLVG